MYSVVDAMWNRWMVLIESCVYYVQEENVRVLRKHCDSRSMSKRYERVYVSLELHC
jgi:hypothetical protein